MSGIDLDEPTSSLDDEEVEKLFVLMRKLKDQGVGIIFVTHFLEQVYEVCDRITVLRNGHLVGEYPVKELPRVELVAKMMGKISMILQILKEIIKSWNSIFRLWKRSRLAEKAAFVHLTLPSIKVKW